MIVPAWLREAEAEARSGVVEIPGPAHDARILRYHATTTLRATDDETPWCASFVGYCLERAHFRSTASARARSYLAWGVELAVPAHGAVVVLKRGRGQQPGPEDLTAPGHVGFLVGEPTLEELLVLGGNQGDAVNVRPYRRADLLSVRWPALGPHQVPEEG